MNSERFDRLTRNLVKRLSRRSVLQLLGALGGRLLADRADAAAAAGRHGRAAVAAGSATPVTATPTPASRWLACPRYPEFQGVPAQCTFVSVPVAYEDPDGESLSVFVARVLGSAPAAHKRGQLWFVTGGPGASAIGFVPQAQRLAALRPAWDYYVFEQRGVGNSAPLVCAAADGAAIITPDIAPACLAELDQAHPNRLGAYTVTNTAHDLAHVIDELREPDREVAVYGVSYGTYLLQRYLTLHGDQPDAVILDSIEAVERANFDAADRDVNDAAHQLMDRCAQDAACHQRLSAVAATPWDALTLTLERSEQDTLCPALQAGLAEPLTRADLRILFGTMVEQVPLRALIPPTVLRLNRCQPDDVTALEQLITPIFFDQTAAPPPVDPGPGYVPYAQVKFSGPLFTHIVLSELWGGTSLHQAERKEEGYNASLRTVVDLAELAEADVWPVYDPPMTRPHAATDQPVLMLNSDLDAQTPLGDAEAIRQDLDGPQQTFVTMPDAGHIVIFNSLLAGAKEGDDPADQCGTQVMLSFLDDPSRAPDTNCTADVYRLSFEASNPRNRESSLAHFGTEDMWGDSALASSGRCVTNLATTSWRGVLV